jgi:hypothetical protein
MCYTLLGMYDAPVTCEAGGEAHLLHPRKGGTMPIEIREFVLREGVKAEDFEKFMIEELFSVVQTVYSIRLGMHTVHHRLLKTEPRTYWWMVELLSGSLETASPTVGEVEAPETGDAASITPFPTDISNVFGELSRLATSTLRTPFPVLARTTEVITTPSPAFLEGNRDGWFGHG